MKLSTKITRRLFFTLVIGVAVAGVAAPMASARPEGMTPLQWYHWQQARQVDTSTAPSAISAVDRERIKSHLEAVRAQSAQIQTGQTTVRTPEIIVGNLHPYVPSVTTATVVDRGFDWGDATIGAGTGMALALLLGGMLLVVRRLSGDGHGRLAT
jgi:hypothetical protein